MNRNDVKSLFLTHAPRMAVLNIQPFGKPWMYTALFNRVHLLAVIVVNSSDYWELRLHLSKRANVGMVICWKHDSCLPVGVLSLETGQTSEPYAIPTGHDPIAEGRTRGTSKVFMGMLLSGVQRAYDALNNDMPYQTKNRYLHRLQALSKHKRGRPI